MRKTNLPPKPILNLINLVNLAPMNIEFPFEEDLIEMFEQKTGKILQDSREYFWDFLQPAVKKICEPYPKLLKHIDRHNAPENDFTIDVSSEYFMFLDDRVDIRNLIETAQDALKTGRSSVVTDSRPGSNFMISVSVSDEGKFEVFSRSFLQAIDGVDAKRLKMCPICDAVFWAYRLNQKWCSKKCSNFHHQKLLRDDEERRQKANEDRRNNHKHNKKLERIKKKK